MDTKDSPRPNELARIARPPAGPPARSPLSPPGPSADSGPKLTPRTILRAVRRYWWQALILWVAASAALCALIYAKVDPDYEASSVLRVDTSSRNVIDRSRGDEEMDSYLATQINLVTNPNVLSVVVGRREVARLAAIREAEDAEARLREMVRAEVIPGTELIRVSATSNSRSEPAVVVNAVVDQFLEMDRYWSAAMTREQIEQMEGYRQQLEEEVGRLEGELLALAEKGDLDKVLLRRSGPEGSSAADPGGSIGPIDAAGDRLTPDEYVELRMQRNRAELDLASVEARLPTLRERASRASGGPAAEAAAPPLEQLLQSDPEVAAAGRAYAAARGRYEEAERRARKPSDPTRRQALEEMRAAYDAYRELWQARGEQLRRQMARGIAIASGPGAGGDPVAEALWEAEQEAGQLRVMLEILDEQLEQVDVINKEQSTDAVRAAFVQADWESQRAMLESVEARLEQLKIDAGGQSRIIQVSEADVPEVPVSDKRLKFMAAAPVGVLGAVLALLTLLEMWSARVCGPEDLSGRMPVEVFSVPPLPVVRPGRELPGRDDPLEMFVQQLDHLRVALCGEAAGEGPGRCILVTSAAGGEGKTTLAAQLAVRCAESGASTLLIDADLRRASLGRLFEVPECPGLSDVLRGEVAVEDALVPVSQVGGCQLLPAGTPEDNPGRVLQGHRIGPMLERLRQSFDLILIDTPPVLPVPDAVILGRRADGVVMAARHDRSRFPLVERAHRLLAGAGVPLLGVVVNGVRPAEIRYGTYAYSYRATRADGRPAGSA